MAVRGETKGAIGGGRGEHEAKFVGGEGHRVDRGAMEGGVGGERVGPFASLCFMPDSEGSVEGAAGNEGAEARMCPTYLPHRCSVPAELS